MEIVVGAAVSLLTQFLKQYSSNTYLTLGIVLILSLIGAGIYTFLVSAGYWQTFANVLVLAGAFYTFIIARFES